MGQEQSKKLHSLATEASKGENPIQSEALLSMLKKLVQDFEANLQHPASSIPATPSKVEPILTSPAVNSTPIKSKETVIDEIPILSKEIVEEKSSIYVLEAKLQLIETNIQEYEKQTINWEKKLQSLDLQMKMNEEFIEENFSVEMTELENRIRKTLSEKTEKIEEKWSQRLQTIEEKKNVEQDFFDQQMGKLETQVQDIELRHQTLEEWRIDVEKRIVGKLDQVLSKQISLEQKITDSNAKWKKLSEIIELQRVAHATDMEHMKQQVELLMNSKTEAKQMIQNQSEEKVIQTNNIEEYQSQNEQILIQKENSATKTPVGTPQKSVTYNILDSPSSPLENHQPIIKENSQETSSPLQSSLTIVTPAEEHIPDPTPVIKRVARIASGSWDKSIKLWDLQSKTCISTLEGHSGNIWCVIGLEANRIATGSVDASIKIWNIQTGQCEHTFEGHSKWVACLLAFDSQHIISGSYDKSLKIWNMETKQCEFTLRGHTAPVSCVAKLNEHCIISGSENKKLIIWDVHTGQQLVNFYAEEHGSYILSICVLDSQRIITGSGDKTLKLWNIETQECITTFKGHSHWVLCVTKLNTQQIVSGSIDHTIKVWNIETGECVLTLFNDSQVKSVITLDEQTVISGDEKGKVKLWNMLSGQCICTLDGHSNRVMSVALIEHAFL